MPEGDTVHKIAGYLAPRLIDHILQLVRMADATASQACTGRRVRGVFARGKHLFVELDDGSLIRSHLGMYGSWHRYSRGEAWRKPRYQASLELVTGDELFVCFNAMEVELVDAHSVRERILETRLGPDLIDANLDLKAVARRARELLTGDTHLVDVLLDQRIAAGIGNVYKSEVLFIHRHAPLTLLESIGDPALMSCFETAAVLLQRNLGGGPRTTRFERDGAGRLWVYGRTGLPCLRCEHRISYARLGKSHRSTYWCTGCQ